MSSLTFVLLRRSSNQFKSFWLDDRTAKTSSSHIHTEVCMYELFYDRVPIRYTYMSVLDALRNYGVLKKVNGAGGSIRTEIPLILFLLMIHFQVHTHRLVEYNHNFDVHYGNKIGIEVLMSTSEEAFSKVVEYDCDLRARTFGVTPSWMTESSESFE